MVCSWTNINSAAQLIVKRYGLVQSLIVFSIPYQLSLMEEVTYICLKLQAKKGQRSMVSNKMSCNDVELHGSP